MTEAEHRAWWAARTDVAYGLCWCGCGDSTLIATYTNKDKGYARGRPTAFLRGHATTLKRRTEAEALPEPNPSGICMCGCGQKTPLAKQTKTQAGWVRGKPLSFLPNHFPRKLTKEQEAEVCRRYAGGKTCDEIGTSFGVSRKTVARVLECHGVSIRPRSTPRPDLRRLSAAQEAEICQRYEAGESSEALGKAFSVSGITVRKALERNRVQRRPGIAGPPLSAEQRTEICRRYVDGEHHKAIAAAFDIEPGTVYRVLKREGVKPHIVPYTDEQRDEICRRYLAGDEVNAICETANMNVSTLYTILRDNGIERARMIWATKAEEAEICRRYAEGQSCPVLARDFDVTDGAILGVLQRHGVPRRSGSEALRRYSCDHAFFDEIDTEAKAYWLGFIAADGCVTDKNVLSISLSSRDHDHLIRFKADIQASHPVASYTATTKPPGSREARTASVSSISIASPQLAEALAKQGVVPRKTFVLGWPEHLPPELLRHFLRGYSDGDGCFHVSRSSYVRKRDGERAAQLNWSIIGTELLCGGARRYLGHTVEASRIELRPHSESPGIFTLHYGGNRQVSRIYHLLYDDATVFLPRKREVARPYALLLVESKPYGPSVSQAVEMRGMYEAGQSSTAIGERFGFSGGTVLKALRRQGVEIRPSASTSPFTEEQSAAIRERYLAGDSSEMIAKEMRISASMVLNILERCGIQRRSASEGRGEAHLAQL